VPIYGQLDVVSPFDSGKHLIFVEFQDARTTAAIMKKAPTPEINVKTSFNKIEETAKATGYLCQEN
jgi:hypothetical protein